MPTASRDLAINELIIGEPLPCDVLDASGIVLLRRGLVLSSQVVDGWRQRGFTRVLLSDSATSSVSDNSNPFAAKGSARLLQPYSPTLVHALSENFERAKQVVDDILTQLSQQEVPELTGLEEVFQQYMTAVHCDQDAVLNNAACQKLHSPAVGNDSLAARSVLMAMLGTVTAYSMGLSNDDCQNIATAGLLHDMALYEETQAMLQRDYTGSDERREVLFRHALHSAELFRGCRGVSDLVRVIITQVHEQVDGRGFPRGLPGHHLNILSRILNIVDAYLTLIEPNQAQPAFMPSDAIAYMIHHTNNGSFDCDCMKAFLKAMSIYSVGSRVELDDSRPATVLRSSLTDPLRPIVRIDDGSETIIDLRHSELVVTRPACDPHFPHRQRLPKSLMPSVLWKPNY